MEQKSHFGEVKELNDKGEGILRFITFHTVDKDGDVTLPGFVGRQSAMLLPGHDWQHIPLGRGESFEDEHAAYFRFKLNMDLQSARDWYSHLRFDQQFGKSLQEISYGFSIHPEGSAAGEKEGQRVRYLKSRPDGQPGARLFELSFVLVGAGVETGVVDVKNLYSPSTRRYWPGGGITPMKGVKEHVSEAVTSVRSSQRHFQTARRLLGEIPMTAKTQRLGEFLDAGLDELDTGIVSIETGKDILHEGGAPPPVEVSPVTPQTPVAPPPTASAEPADQPLTETNETGEKGGMPIHDDLEQVMRSVELVTDRLEHVKVKRAEESPRYPHGRPMSSERLGQVEALMTRLSRLKVSTEQREQHEAEQHALQEMTERLKRLGVTV